MASKEPKGRLVAASSDGHLDQVRSLLEDNQFQEFDLLSGFHEALRNGHVEVIREYLKRGLNTNAVFKKRSLVSNACVHGQPEVLELLLQSGANVNPDKQSSLLGATHLGMNIGWDFYRGEPGSVYQMIGHDPLPKSWNKEEINRRRNEMVAILLKFHVKTEVLSNQGHSPLYQCCEEGLTEVVRMMAESGCNLEYGTRKGAYPLYESCRIGRVEIVRILINNGANIKVRYLDDNFKTPLHIACYNNHAEIAKLLIEAGADVNAEDEERFTPLMLASANGHVKAARVLLGNGAKVNAGNKFMITALHLACAKGRVEMIKLLVENGADLAATDNRMFSPLYLALHANKRGAAELLLGLGANVDQFHGIGMAMLHHACKLDDVKVVKGLIQLGADVNKMDETGHCPLHYASTLEKTAVVQLLLNHGAEVNKKTRFYQTALFIACGSGPQVKEELVSVLLEKGADLNLENDAGVTPVALARIKHRPDLEALLVKHGADASSLPPPPRQMDAGDIMRQIEELMAKSESA